MQVVHHGRKTRTRPTARVSLSPHQVDKDVAVAREHFGLSAPYSTMSPLVLHRGYTKQFLDGKVSYGCPAQPAAASGQALGVILLPKLPGLNVC